MLLIQSSGCSIQIAPGHPQTRNCPGQLSEYNQLIHTYMLSHIASLDTSVPDTAIDVSDIIPHDVSQ